ncbi:hypothetical protein I580_00044 [Enterococcus caccae ATCC BAA-1240]|nr:hypothetical protein I580_00044 [Enterococcus caccae ATCC BAA-1240]
MFICDEPLARKHQLIPLCVLQQFQLISEGSASDPTVYSHLGCETKVIVTFVPHPYIQTLILWRISQCPIDRRRMFAKCCHCSRYIQGHAFTFSIRPSKGPSSCTSTYCSSCKWRSSLSAAG